MGPTGDLYEPIGPLSIAEGAKAYAEQAQGLAAGGADVLWLETLSSLEEIQAAIQGAQTTELPFVVTVSFDSNGKTMMGLSPTEFADWVRGLSTKPIAFGANCGSGTPDLAASLLAIGKQNQPDILVAKSNAGIPQYKDGEFVFSGTPEHMARYAVLMRDMGAKIIGGCCGTSPEHLKAMRDALERSPKGETPSLETIVAELGRLNLAKADKASREGRRGRRA
jgi:5-methyltetrahydrofolate--homocysteine methyltransferase